MTILFVHSGSDFYGASRSLLRLTSRLVKDGTRVVVMLPYDGPLHEALEGAGVEVRIDPTLTIVTRSNLRGFRDLLLLPFRAVRSVRGLLGVIRAVHPDIVHTNTAIVLTPGVAARLARVPHLWHVRESFGEFGRLWSMFQWFMFAFSSKVICVSDAVRQQFIPYIRERKTLVIHNGIPASEFGPVTEDRIRDFRRTFKLESFLLVGVVGRLKMVRKGQDTFLKAAALLSADHPEARFVLIGSPFPGNESHGTALVALARELGIEDRVVFTGDVADIRAAYAALDVSVLPSEQPEPFGGVVIESMAAGKAVIGTRIGGTCEQIADGESGVLVTPGDPHSLSIAMGRLLGDAEGRDRMGGAGRKRFETLFEFERFYARMVETYHAIAKGVA